MLLCWPLAKGHKKTGSAGYLCIVQGVCQGPGAFFLPHVQKRAYICRPEIAALHVGRLSRTPRQNNEREAGPPFRIVFLMVGTSSFELLTSSMSRKRSTPELRAYMPQIEAGSIITAFFWGRQVFFITQVCRAFTLSALGGMLEQYWPVTWQWSWGQCRRARGSWLRLFP